MSLVRFAARYAAVEAVRGNTLVGENVLDSEIGAIDVSSNSELKTSKQKPFTAVYTEKSKSNLSGNDLRNLFENGTCEICFETGVTAAMTETDPETGKNYIMPGIPMTDRAQETFLDLTNYQIGAALADPNNEWAEVFRGLCVRFSGIEIVRAGSQSEGIRIAAQQLKIEVVLIDNPVPREELLPDTPFHNFLELLKSQPENSKQLAYAATIEALIAGEEQPWENCQRRFGMTRAELLALGLGPIAQDEDRETPEVTEIPAEVGPIPDENP